MEMSEDKKYAAKDYKTKKNTDKLFKCSLPEIDMPNKNGKYAHLSKIKNGICVLRGFECNGSSQKEILRIYFDKNFSYDCKIDDSTFTHNLNNDYLFWKKSALLNTNKEYLKGTRLEYIIDIVDELCDDLKCFGLYCFNKYDVFEKLYKSGYKNICLYVLNNGSGNNPYNILCEIFDIQKDGKKNNNIYNLLQLNKYQLKIINELSGKFYKSDNLDIGILIKTIKKWFDCNITDIDNKTFNNAIELFDYCKQYIYGYDIFSVINKIILKNGFKKTYDNKEKIYSIIAEDNFKSYRIVRIYDDYLSIISHPAISGFKCFFKETKELKNSYNSALKEYNLIKTHFNESAFKQMEKKWNKYAFEDSEYLITYPKTPQELETESVVLNHCVRSYVNDIANKKTNILFLRKKEKQNIPFYTIEIDNNDNIKQIKGTNNKILKDKKEIIFIEKWAKEKNLTLL